MNLIAKKLVVLSLSAMGLLMANQSYASLTIDTPGGSADTDGSVGAQAVFSLVGDVLTIQLSSLVANPTSAGQLISGIEFDVSGGTTATLNSSLGVTTTIAPGGSYTPSSGSQNLPKWTLASSSGSSIDLSTFGKGSPYDMIIGADNKGGFLGKGKYNDANSSIYNHQPVVLGTATFMITVNGLSSLSQLSDVQFLFGTGPDGTICAGINTPTPVPEPTTVIAGLVMLVPLSIQLLRAVRNRKQPALVKVIKRR